MRGPGIATMIIGGATYLPSLNLLFTTQNNIYVIPVIFGAALVVLGGILHD